MKLKVLLKNLLQIDVKGSKEIEVSGISSHSKFVAPGDLFIARRGSTHDGNRFIPEAISAGAVCILSDVFDPSIKGVTQLIAQDVSRVESLLAASFWSWPSKELHMVGITGTSGKTTTSYLVHHLFAHFRMPAGLIGTVEYITGTRHCEAPRTTPDVVTNQRLLRDIVKSGAKACVMEVSSHALVQGRVSEIGFDTAIFTNLSHEHLDYHKTMEEYARAKNRLFRSLEGSRSLEPIAIFNAQDTWVAQIAEGTTARCLTYAVDGAADVVASNIVTKSTESSFTLTCAAGSVSVHLPLIGRYNVENALAAASTFIARGYALADIAAGLSTASAPPGRLERVYNSLDLKVYVDYAHKEDALRKVLQTLRSSTQGRIIVVFGCGGDRDREKRPKMAQAAEELADVVIVTSDNPRSEDPLQIIEEIARGFTLSSHFRIPDREKAIHAAIDMATPEDLVLIAGKGHEKYQVFSTSTVPFDDCAVVREYCTRKKTTSSL